MVPQRGCSSVAGKAVRFDDAKATLQALLVEFKAA